MLNMIAPFALVTTTAGLFVALSTDGSLGFPRGRYNIWVHNTLSFDDAGLSKLWNSIDSRRTVGSLRVLLVLANNAHAELDAPLCGQISLGVWVARLFTLDTNITLRLNNLSAPLRQHRVLLLILIIVQLFILLLVILIVHLDDVKGVGMSATLIESLLSGVNVLKAGIEKDVTFLDTTIQLSTKSSILQPRGLSCVHL